MQRPTDLRRVAAECVDDLAADGVVYAEVRYAPEQHLDGGADASTRSSRPSRTGSSRARPTLPPRGGRSSYGRSSRRMRQAANSREIAELAVRHRDNGVCGFDIAGAEAGFPPTRHLDAFEYLQRAERPLHDPRRRGVRPAVDLGGPAVVRRRAARPRRPDRRRHRPGRRPARARPAGGYVRDRRVPLEMCPSSNLQTGAAPSIAEHPDRAAHRAALPGDGQHRQPADERHHDEP